VKQGAVQSIKARSRERCARNPQPQSSIW
jgi:hypothetical protein